MTDIIIETVSDDRGLDIESVQPPIDVVAAAVDPVTTSTTNSVDPSAAPSVIAEQLPAEARQQMIGDFLGTVFPTHLMVGDVESNNNNDDHDVYNNENDGDSRREEDNDSEDNSINDSNGTDDDEDSPSRCSRCCQCFRQKMNNLLSIISYPFVIVFTIISLIMIVTFCIIPTMFCMTLGICAYYCFMDDPIPLHLLLRYMFSPDTEAETAFGNGGGVSAAAYPLAHNRPLIQSKLIVRRLTKVTTNSSDDNDKVDDDTTTNDEVEDSTTKYPRRHPAPILVWTESKCMYFSEPLVFAEEENGNDKTKKKRRRHRRRRTGDAAVATTTTTTTTASNGGNQEGDEHAVDSEETGDNSILSTASHNRASVLREPSNRNIEEGTPDIRMSERRQAAELELVEIPSGDGTPVMTNSDLVEEEALGSDEEMGNIPISLGQSAGNIQEDTDVEGCIPPSVLNEERSGINEEEHMHESRSSNDIVCQECDDSKSVEKEATCEEEAPSLTAATATTPNLQTDYFGIESDSRDRHTACDICLLEYEIGDEVAWSPNMLCSHTYHKDCILDWLVRKPSCPNCRHDYTKDKKNGRGG